jgi:precorrin-6B methylase 2
MPQIRTLSAYFISKNFIGQSGHNTPVFNSWFRILFRQGSIIMDAKRLQEIDRKIKRYEGIDILLSHDLQEENGDAVTWEEVDNTTSENLRTDKNEQG